MALKDNPEIRYALWQAYKRRCAICKEDLFEYSNLEIDHIIPEKKFKNSKEAKEVKEKYNLPVNFDFDGLENLRPTHHTCNNNKSGRILPDEVIVGILYKAGKIVKEVKKYIKQFENEAKYALNIEAIRKQLKEGNISLEEYTDRISNYIADFGEDEYISEKSDFVRYKNRTVKLEGYFPILNDYRGTCLFTFNSFYIRGTNIDLGHREILSELYPGHNTPIDFGLRRYIVEKIDDENFIIQLGNVKFNLNFEEVSNLCNVIDKFIIKYLEALKKVEMILECQNFIPNSSDKSKYQLIKIKMDTWKQVLDFSKENDFSKGNSKWHIFDASGKNMLKVYIKEDTNRWNEGYKCLIHSYIEDPNSWTPSDYVWLLWNNASFDKTYGNGDFWTVNETYNWLTKELLPEVIHVNSSRDIVFSSPIINIQDHYVDGEIRWITSENIKNKEQLISMLEELQATYLLVYDMSVGSNEISKLFQAILESVKISENLNLNYICLKLKINLTMNDKAEVEKNINDKINYYNRLDDLIKISSDEVDILFRVLIFNLRNTKRELSAREIKSYLTFIDWYIENYNSNKLVENYK